MTPMGFRQPRDNRAKMRRRQPNRGHAAKNAVAPAAFARNYQYSSCAVCPGPCQKRLKRGAGLILAQPMQVDPPTNGLTVPGYAMVTSRFDGLWWPDGFRAFRFCHNNSQFLWQ